MSGARKAYGAAGRAGCVQLRRAQQTGTTIGVYDGEQAGLDTDDGAYPWSTVCEDHGQIICHQTLATALHHAPDPIGWCEECARRTGKAERA